MSQWDELIRLLDERMRDRVIHQLRWAVVEKVDWSNRLADATGIADDLGYHDIRLGLGSQDLRPKVGSRCLLLVIEGQSPATYLLTAEALEGLTLQAQGETLRSVLSDFMDEVMKIVVVHGNTVDVAALTAIKGRLNKILIDD